MFRADSLEMNSTRPQPALGHRRSITAGEAHAAQHIDFEQAQPVAVRDLEERLALVDAEVVDQDVDVGDAREHRFRPRGGGAIRSDAIRLGVADRVAQPRERCIDRGLGAAGERDPRTLCGQAMRDGIADATGRAGDQCVAILQLQIHGHFSGE